MAQAFYSLAFCGACRKDFNGLVAVGETSVTCPRCSQKASITTAVLEPIMSLCSKCGRAADDHRWAEDRIVGCT